MSAAKITASRRSTALTSIPSCPSAQALKSSRKAADCLRPPPPPLLPPSGLPAGAGLQQLQTALQTGEIVARRAIAVQGGVRRLPEQGRDLGVLRAGRGRWPRHRVR